MNLQQAYRAARAPVANAFHVWQQPASHALNTARTRLAWDAAGGVVRDDWDTGPCPGRVRLVLKADNSGCDPLDGMEAPERIVQEERDRANRDGVWGVRGEYWDGHEWVEVDSCWGFIGDDWRDSGYDVDIMRATLDALAEHDASQARAMEAERPDLYA